MSNVLRFSVVIFGLLFSTTVVAEGPPLACDPRTQYEVCAIKIQRNNVLDEMATIDAQRRRALDRIDDINAWWKSYLEGLEQQRQQAASEASGRVARAAEVGKVRVR